jgi:preprotein translocase subunit Sec63
MEKYEKITKALQILRLSDSATLKEIKSSYHALLKEWHPDLANGKEDDFHEKTMEIIEAYRALREYCEGYRFSFSREEVENHLSPEELWMEQFGNDPIWGNPDYHKEKK